ncbi:hypothetical protein OUZ56_026562 [Daphnia magna]|uniref:Secreted protein n=1 Tax=Daphnia magna TaxID=35525 RepID=A0ABQ9ZM67_9CRUS|nr:hypothetical protein OUZ56_026562 [Daphnia magna]
MGLQEFFIFVCRLANSTLTTGFLPPSPGFFDVTRHRTRVAVVISETYHLSRVRRSERRAKSLKLEKREREHERRPPERKLNDCNAI